MNLPSVQKNLCNITNVNIRYVATAPPSCSTTTCDTMGFRLNSEVASSFSLSLPLTCSSDWPTHSDNNAFPEASVCLRERPLLFLVCQPGKEEMVLYIAAHTTWQILRHHQQHTTIPKNLYSLTSVKNVAVKTMDWNKASPELVCFCQLVSLFPSLFCTVLLSDDGESSLCERELAVMELNISCCPSWRTWPMDVKIKA